MMKKKLYALYTLRLVASKLSVTIGVMSILYNITLTLSVVTTEISLPFELAIVFMATFVLTLLEWFALTKAIEKAEN